ncbi:hypothetical protein [Geodermatophilus normandii]|uniref:Toxin-antitoxin system HicB family antitoxin n=1 Tax=Geodermatophilus normandii TaxID=1137989 RepID=A0A6P0GGV5_9ACTN|nr:hypothetical protein [Geodermatophilus normandii]NEM06441.1 hypothetical protein [Geodermatophilus normandii]
MDLAPYVEQLRRDLLLAAAPGGEEARELAERLTAPLEASVRLALLSALSAAAEELTSQLAPGAVDVRLRGSDIGFVVTPPPASAEAAHEPPAPEPGIPDADDGTTIRITLRLPEQLKVRVEEAAARLGSSVNTWLVRAVTDAVARADRPSATDGRRSRWSGGSQYTGWAR